MARRPAGPKEYVVHPSLTFHVGEKVVYPNHGVATIENISSRAFAGHFERFYLLKLSYTSMTVMVPFSNAADIGLRRITKDREIARILQRAPQRRR